MYAARLVVIVLLIVAVVVTYDPQARADVMEIWETIRPGLVAFVDSCYLAIRDLMTGNGSNDHIDETPGPGLNFERIVTLDSGTLF